MQETRNTYATKWIGKKTGMNSTAALHRVFNPGGERALEQSKIARPTRLYKGLFDHRIFEDLNP